MAASLGAESARGSEEEGSRQGPQEEAEVIRIVTLAPFDEGDIAYVARALYQAFGLGTEHVGERNLPVGTESEDGRYDGARLLEAVPSVRTFADDKVLYLATVPLSMEPGPLGEPPCYGFARYGGDRPLVSTSTPSAGTRASSAADSPRPEIGGRPPCRVRSTWARPSGWARSRRRRSRR